MITYSPLTQGKLIESVISKVGKFRNNVNIDYYTLAIMAYHAQNEIMTLTIPYKDWAYVTTTAITNGTVLPRTFHKQIRVILSSLNNIEARYATPMEYFKTTNSGIIWSNAYNIQPVYTLWGLQDNTGQLNEAQIVIYVSPSTATGIIEYYNFPAFTDNANSVVNIPYEFENLLVLSTLQRIMHKLGDKEKIQELQKEILTERNKISKLLLEKKRTAKREIDVYVSPDSPIVQQVNEGKRI